MSPQPDSNSQPPVGIDLGTTYSVVAHIDAAGRPVTVLNGEGELLTPSAVLCDQNEVVVGRQAVRASALEPDAYAECFKRDIGGDVYHRKIRGVDVPPEVLSALILERLKTDAEKRLGPIRQVVVTVPAFFDELRRKATQDAGRLAGLEVLDIINEPTAAALAYGYHQGFFDPARANANAAPVRVLVYDLGGGTFDVTLLEIAGTQFRALATDGDVRLGGKDFDERLVNHLAEQFLGEHGADPRSEPQDAAQLWLDVQEAKHSLSQRSRTAVIVFHAGMRMKIEVTRDQFQDLTRDLLERTESTTSLVVKEAGLDWTQVDRVLLVGGSSRMPMVTDMLRRVTGKEPDVSLSPDEVVAHGAALYAAMLMNQGGSSPLAGARLMNVNSHSLGIVGLDVKTRRRQNVIVIPKNTPLPCRVSRVFVTAKDDQRSVKVAVVEGESHRPEECIALGECVVRDLPSGLPKGTRVQVEYSYAANGRISVAARMPSVRQSAQVEIERHQERDLGQLAAWRTRLIGADAGKVSEFAADSPVDLNDPSSVLRRLDALHVRIGQAAVAAELPRALRRSQEAARAAAGELEKAAKTLQQAESARHAVSGRAETIRFSSELARAKAAYEQALTQADFAHLVLGRECLAKRVLLPGVAKEIEEIERLRTQVA
ncbi:MAG: Hsp70 family protein [Candidatus Anammoximicrobium sp.]|nr:Hsp70 family protein [Candidatus Anammoximicrobium sp.]